MGMRGRVLRARGRKEMQNDEWGWRKRKCSLWKGMGWGGRRVGRKVLMRNRAQSVPLSCLKRAGRIGKDAPKDTEGCRNHAQMQEGRGGLVRLRARASGGIL